MILYNNMLSRVQTGGTRFMTMMTKMLQATVMMALAHHSSCNFLGTPSGEGRPAVAGLPLHNIPAQHMPLGLARLLQVEHNIDEQEFASSAMHEANCNSPNDAASTKQPGWHFACSLSCTSD